ncbi:hypothetical protein GQ651_16225 [Alphaproteobacteria bacterium GH1-50]|uniref:Uncharacterized protein n=1 Tax=Kangsaoukella pontilimi TaxID=2691042 RepID=A0A7C9MYS3_9RHOB|nr:hypothetical protein [Kangsaoukella pontilimi]MXQ09394.1 hypothetical protein [Kangsaoukella pontilimi]
MDEVATLMPSEVVCLEMEQIVRLADQIGVLGADRAASASVEEIVERLCIAEAAWASGEFARLAEASKSLVGIAEDVGMRTLSDVAREVASAACGNDPVAVAALVARQSRVGEASLAAIWNLGSIRV